VVQFLESIIAGSASGLTGDFGRNECTRDPIYQLHEHMLAAHVANMLRMA